MVSRYSGVGAAAFPLYSHLARGFRICRDNLLTLSVAEGQVVRAFFRFVTGTSSLIEGTRGYFGSELNLRLAHPAVFVPADYSRVKTRSGIIIQ
jgi:hypothetical protein